MVRFLYGGIEGRFRDVTGLCLIRFLRGMSFHIPASDGARAERLGDPFPGQEKTLVAVTDDGKHVVIPAGVEARITFTDEIARSAEKAPVERVRTRPEWSPEENIRHVHANVSFALGIMNDEMVEQRMAATFIPSTARVLEIGANIGRNSVLISSILEDPTNLVSLECNPDFIALLTHNRDINKAGFHIVDAALSYRRLAMKDWDTVVIGADGVIPEGHFEVRTVTFEDLTETYGSFDTLVADCEGALRYILEDCPQLLDGMKLVVLENDYHDIAHYEFVKNMLELRGFERVFVHGPGWGPCIDNFHEVWRLD